MAVISARGYPVDVKNLLLITGGQPGGRLERMADAVVAGAVEFQDEVSVHRLPALEAKLDDLLRAHALIIGTPEKFGYMSGAVKDFFDRTFYPAEGKVDALPFALFVSAGNDGTGAVSSIERIANGYRWTRVAEPVVIKGEPDEVALARCRELGATLAAGLALGVF
jgi:multimeric flavodoxin WrbA